jgi:Skp family chaperone for outer membrane proteins
MADTFWSLYSSLDIELLQIASLIKGARCVREHKADANVETDLLSLAKEIVEESRKTLEEINEEYRKLEKETKTDTHATRGDTAPENEEV